jgi:5'-AMP-activated protein kinase catalytic alpha subunit
MGEELPKVLCGYMIKKVLGQGSFGTVKLGIHPKTGEQVAIKTLNYKAVRSPKELDMIQREKDILKTLDHPNIVKLKEVVEDPDKEKCHMLFEYVSGGELFAYIVAHGRLKEKDARRFVRQMVSGLEYCHNHLIIHRDLKPENLLLDEHLNIKITDFGLANRITPGAKFQTFCGSLLYAAPEILRGEAYQGPGVDIWALGIILFCLIAGRQPYDGDNPTRLLKLFNHPIPFPDHVSPECKDIIKRMLTVSERDRITISEIKRHPWINSGYTAPIDPLLPAVSFVNTLDPEVLKQLQLLGFEDSPNLRRAILQSEPKNPAVTMYHTISRNLRRAGISQSTNSASESEYSSITDSAACDSAESAGSERKAKARSNSRGESHSKRKSVGFESVGGSDSSEHAAASLPSSPAPEPAKRRNLTQSMGGNPAAVMQAKAAKEAMARHSHQHHEKKKSGEHVMDPLRRSHNPNAPSVPHGSGAQEEPATRRRGNSVVVGVEFDDFVPRAVTSVDPDLVKKMRRRSDKPVSKKREEPPKDKDAKDKKDKKDKKTKVKKEKFEAVEEEITIADLPAKKEKKDDKKKDRRKSDSSSRHKGDVKKEKDEKKTIGVLATDEPVGLFGANTTSTKSANEIAEQVNKTLDGLNVRRLEMPNATLHLSCVFKNIAFEVELVEIGKFENMRGLKFTRRSGDIWE